MLILNMTSPKKPPYKLTAQVLLGIAPASSACSVGSPCRTSSEASRSSAGCEMACRKLIVPSAPLGVWTTYQYVLGRVPERAGLAPPPGSEWTATGVEAPTIRVGKAGRHLSIRMRVNGLVTSLPRSPGT